MISLSKLESHSSDKIPALSRDREFREHKKKRLSHSNLYCSFISFRSTLQFVKILHCFTFTFAFSFQIKFCGRRRKYKKTANFIHDSRARTKRLCVGRKYNKKSKRNLYEKLIKFNKFNAVCELFAGLFSVGVYFDRNFCGNFIEQVLNKVICDATV
jgi:hypothetical protein